jgi:RNA polymerase sigma factor (sigma-70 family)
MNVGQYNKAVDQYSDNIFRFALKHLKNEMSAEDIVQETFTKVWEKHEEIDAEKVKSYLFTTAYHNIMDWFKKENRQDEKHYDGGDLTADEVMNFDVQTILHQAIDTLPEIQKSVVLLRDYEGYSYEEIAEICKISDSQVKVYIFRARKSLKAILKDSELLV